MSALEQFAVDEDIEIVAITVALTEIVRALPMHHSDPFDRVIIATAIDKSSMILSIDAKLDVYSEVQRLW